MKNSFRWQLILGVSLLSLSTVVYFIHFLIFRDIHHIFIYLIGDIGFVFFEVLIVTLLIHQLLSYRDKKSMLKKLNMVIGAFFSEVGTELIKLCYAFDDEKEKNRGFLLVDKDWSRKKFKKSEIHFLNLDSSINLKNGDMEELKNFLVSKRNFLLTLLENPNLLEHESFTDLLWAVFHLTEELVKRQSINNLPTTDLEHLANDVKRAYASLVRQWIFYMEHLKKDYPYLFSLAVRTNPFNPDCRVEIAS